MKRPDRVVIIALFIIVVSAGAVLLAGKPPAPIPQVPLVLAGGLNVVTAEVNNQLRAWEIGSVIRQEWAQQRQDLARDLLLLDVDGDTKSEIVVPGACQDSAGQIYAWLTAYEQGVAGERYSGRCDPVQRVPVRGFTYPELASYEINGVAHVVLRTSSDIVVFRLDNGYWTTLSHAVIQDSAALVGVPPGLAFSGRSLAVGDVDGDEVPEIVTVGTYYGPLPTGEYDGHSIILVFDGPELQLKGDLQLSDLFPGFVAQFSFGLALADTDGDGVKEIWCPGWKNNDGATQMEQRLLSVRVTQVAPGNDQLQLAADWNFGWGAQLGPRVASGRLNGKDHDSLAIFNVVNRGKEIGIYDVGPTGLVPLGVIVPTNGFHRIFFVGDQLVLGGELPAVKKLKSGMFLETWDIPRLERTAFFSVRDGSQIATYTVGLGVKQQ